MRRSADHNARFEFLSFEGDPVRTLYLASEDRDLLIAGHDTAFRGNIREQVSGVLAKLLLLTPRPVIICPDAWVRTGSIMIAYDGSVAAMRALQLFTLLGIGVGKAIRIVSIDENHELAARQCAGAASFLRVHGLNVDASPIVTRVHPSEVLTIEANERQAEMLVLGAYGQRGFREFFFGSTTSKLLEDPPCALFLYH